MKSYTKENRSRGGKDKGYKQKLHYTELRKLQIKTLQEEEKARCYEIKLASQKEQADQKL